MAKSPIGKSMPLDIEEFFASPFVQLMRDFQRWWFVSLLMNAWRNSEKPCFLPNDREQLWVLAGAPSKEKFEKHGAIVMARFDASEDGLWLSNKKLAQVYDRQMDKYSKWSENGLKGGRPKTKLKPIGYQAQSSDFDCVSTPVLEVGFKTESFDGEKWFLRIMEFWPHTDRGYQAQTAVFEEVERIVAERGWPRVEAVTWLIEQLKPIAEVIRRDYPKAKWKLYPLAKMLKQYENGAESFRNIELVGNGKQQARDAAREAAFRD